MSSPCGAKTRAGGRCVKPAMPNGRCRFHGGLSLVGPASGTFKHGRYSKLLPKGLAAHYSAARSDRELLGLREEIALVDARMMQLLEQASTSRRRDVGVKAWKTLVFLIEQRRKLVETEAKRLKDLQQLISVERAMTLIAAVADLVRQHVSDRAQLAAISAGLLRLTSGGAREAPLPGRPPVADGVLVDRGSERPPDPA